MSAAESSWAIDLPGLPISSPLGFTAALGLLRVCSQDHGLPAKLSWNAAHAVLHGVRRDALLELLEEQLRDRSKAPEFNFEVTGSDGQRGLVQHFRRVCADDYRAAAASMGGDARALAFLSAFCTDAVIASNGYAACTQWDCMLGPQRLAEEFRRLAKELDPSAGRPRRAFVGRVESSLFGGIYEQQHSFGWDPAGLRTHAQQREAPTDEGTAPGQPMTIWLAVEALPLHPVVPVGTRRGRTTGFTAESDYVWPQWSAALGLEAVTLLRQRPLASLHELPGVSAIWISRTTRAGKAPARWLLPGARTPSVGHSAVGSRAVDSLE